MPRPGRPPASTRAERRRVLELDSLGLSQRQIAERIFGDRRFHGRVARILARHRAATIASGTTDDADPARPPLEATTALLRELIDNLAARLLAKGEDVTAREIAQLMNLQLRLEQREAYERARDLTREQR